MNLVFLYMSLSFTLFPLLCSSPTSSFRSHSLSIQDVDTIFGEIGDLHELSVQLVGSLEECIEMAGEMQGARCPQAGFVFEELAEVRICTYHCGAQ